MRVTKDYHVHSRFSNVRHAKNTVEELVNRAIEVGLDEIAITNHGLCHITYGIREKQLLELREEINRLQKKYPSIKILLGVEANILSYNGDTDITQLVYDNCDIILCGYHTFVRYKTFSDFWNFVVMNFLASKLGWFRERQRKFNTEAIVNVISKNKFDILTHPGEKMIINIEEVAEYAEKCNIILEVNSSHRHLSLEELKVCGCYNIRYAINSDAHSVQTIGEYSSGLDRAEKAAISKDRIINIK